MFMSQSVQERKKELDTCSFRSFLAERDTCYPAQFDLVSKHLGSSWAFKQVAPLQALSKEKGQKIAKKLSFFLRHHLPKGDYLEYDGSVDVDVIQQKVGFSKEDILLATNPEYDGRNKKKANCGT